MKVKTNIPNMPAGDSLGLIFSNDIKADLDAINSPQSQTAFKAYPDISSFIAAIRWYPFPLVSEQLNSGREVGLYEPETDVDQKGSLTIGGTDLNTGDVYQVPKAGKTAKPIVYKLPREEINGALSKSFLDFTSTKFQLYIPYMGFYDISPNDIILSNGQAVDLEIDVIIDLLTGKGTATLFSGGELLNIYEGKIGVDITFGKNNAQEMAINNLQTGMGIAAGTVGGVAAMATGHPLAGLAAMGTAAANAAMQYANNRPSITRGTVGDPLSALYLPMDPYLIIDKPMPVMSDNDDTNYNHLLGKPAGYTAKLGDLKGFTKVAKADLTGITNATMTELNEIEDLLKTGVIF